MGQLTSSSGSKKEDVSAKSAIHKCESAQHSQYGIRLILNAFEKEIKSMGNFENNSNMVNICLPEEIKNMIIKYYHIQIVRATHGKIHAKWDLLFKAIILGFVFLFFLGFLTRFVCACIVLCCFARIRN